MRAVLIFSAALLAGACQTAGPALDSELAPGEWGEASRHNMLAHAVPATVEEKARTFIPADRQRRATAIQIYRDGEVSELQYQNTQGN